VELAISELSYVPQVFRTRRTGIIGVVFDKGWLGGIVANPFYSKVLEGIEEEASLRNLQLLIAGVPEQDIRAGSLPPLITRRYVDGLIAVGGIHQRYGGRLKSGGVPLVLVDHIADDINCVVSNNEGGMYEAARHLLDRGHRKIGFINSVGPDANFAARLAGYRRALAERGIASPSEWIASGDAFSNGGYTAMNKLLSLAPSLTAVLCGNDGLALWALKYAREHGIEIPRQFSIVGFDDIDGCQYVSPTLTTVRVDKQEMGRTAVRIAADLLKTGADPKPAASVTVDTALVVRESSGPAPQLMAK
jgi:LacI family transcriptional regulator